MPNQGSTAPLPPADAINFLLSQCRQPASQAGSGRVKVFERLITATAERTLALWSDTTSCGRFKQLAASNT